MNISKAKTIDELVDCILKHKPYKNRYDFFQNPYNYIIYRHINLLKSILYNNVNKPSKHDLFIIQMLPSHIGSKDDHIIQDILNFYKSRETGNENGKIS